jgi:hypothetical protein
MRSYVWGYAHRLNCLPAASSQHMSWQIICRPLWLRLSHLAGHGESALDRVFEVRSLVIDDLDFREPNWLGVQQVYTRTRPDAVARFHILSAPLAPPKAVEWVESLYFPLVLPTVLQRLEEVASSTVQVLARASSRPASVSRRGGSAEER